MSSSRLGKLEFSAQYKVHFFKHGVYFASDRNLLVLRGDAVRSICSSIDGRKTADEIVDIVANSTRNGYPEIYYALNQLITNKLVAEADLETQDAKAPLNELRAVYGIIHDPRTRAKLSLINRSSVPSTVLISPFTLAGWDCSEARSLKETTVFIVAVDDYLDPGLAEINHQMLNAKLPWILMRPSGSIVRVGPVFTPEGFCWACLAKRLSDADPIHRMYAHQAGASSSFSIQMPGNLLSGTICATLAASRLLTVMALADEHNHLSNRPETNNIISFDSVDLKLTHHPVAKRAQCPVCGDPKLMRRDTAPKLDIPSASTAQKWRLLTEEEMLIRVEPFYDEMTGIVMPILSQTDANLDVPGLVHIFTAKHPHKMNFSEPDVHELYYMSSGKAQTEKGAKLAAICEGIERFSCLYQGNEYVVEGTYNEMIERYPDHVIQPNDIMQFSDRQFDQRRLINKEASPYNYVPMRLDPNVVIRWVPFWRLSTSVEQFVDPTPYYAPSPSLYFGLPSQEARFMSSNSNGLAAGSCLEEALLQSFLEVFERDAVGIWWYNRIQRPGFNLSSMDDEFVQRVCRYLQTVERNFWLIDVSNDIGLPTFAAISSAKHNGGSLVYGFGCHFDVRKAIHSAILEMIQCLPIAFKWEHEGIVSRGFTGNDLKRWLESTSIENCQYLLPNSEEKNFQSYQPIANTIGDALIYSISKVEELNLQAYFNDLTQPDIGIPVTQVVVPGMRIFWDRFAPGRLYDVPVKLGWRESKLKESDLNPFAVFF